MKVLIHSNAPWAGTGYGQQTELLVHLLEASGVEVAVSAFWGLGGRKMDWGKTQVFPADENWGNSLLVAMAHKFGGANADDVLVLTLMDVWVLTNQLLGSLNLASWVPIDHEPGPVHKIPPRVKDFFEKTRSTPIAMSRFGQDQLIDAGLEPLYVPHGIDTQTFKPWPQAQIRQAIGLPEDKFIVGMVAANKGSNPPRKSFPQVLEAFGRFHKTHPDSLLYLHSMMRDSYDGLDLLLLSQAMDVPMSALASTSDLDIHLGFDNGQMSQLYSTFDVLCAPSLGEGFGIPIVEAQACGVPVIVNDCTAMTELCGDGWLVENMKIYDPAQGVYWGYPHVDSIVEKLEEAYERRGGGSEKAREFAEGYDARTVFMDHWVPVLGELEERMTERTRMPEVTLAKVAA